LRGCSLFSNSDLKCNGVKSDTGVVYGYASGTSNCGTYQAGSQGQVTDDFSTLYSTSGISNTCGAASNYHYETDANFATQTSNHLTTSTSWSTSSVVKICGDLQLPASGVVTPATATGGTVLVIYGGTLDLNGGTLRPTGDGLPIVFAGTSSGKSQFPTGSGTLDFGGPNLATGSHWHGIALYQDPAVANSDYQKNGSNLDMTYNGNTPELNLTGLIYMPNAQLTISGSIDHQTNGLVCLGIVAKSVVVSGGGYIFSNPTQDCVREGLTLPSIPGSAARPALVQ
jgi:hypothetical protein